MSQKTLTSFFAVKKRPLDQRAAKKRKIIQSEGCPVESSENNKKIDQVTENQKSDSGRDETIHGDKYSGDVINTEVVDNALVECDGSKEEGPVLQQPSKVNVSRL